MRALTQAIYNRLASDDHLGQGLATYGGSPAVFAGRLAPADATLPFIHIRPVITDTAFDTMTREGRDITRDIAVYGADTGSEGGMDDLAERVRDLFHHKHLPVSGWHTVSVVATGPQDAPEEPGFTGRIVSVRVLLQRA